MRNRIRAADWLAALSLANLIFLRCWTELLSPDGDPGLLCQGKVESSAFEQSRKFWFWVAATATRGMFDPQRRGRAWCCWRFSTANSRAPRRFRSGSTGTERSTNWTDAHLGR
jgi:hypothetical protein